MGVAKYIAPALSVASAALAQSSCSAPTTTIINGGDATALAACSTFSGNVVIQSGAAVASKVALDGLQEIDGDVTYMNDNSVTTFSASTLQKISGDLNLMNLTQLSSIDLGQLTTVGNIKYASLSSLTNLGFGTPGINTVGNVTIDNTQVSSLAGVANASSISGLAVTDNSYLGDISLSAKKIDNLIIGPNDVNSPNDVPFEAPNLVSAGTVTIRNCSAVSLPLLTQASVILELIGNTFSSLILPNVTWVGGLVIDDNTALTNLSFPALMAINGTNSTLDLANNTKLLSIGGFGNLQTVNGGVNLAGNFTNATFPSISKIGGALNIDTASPNFDCSTIPGTGSQIVRGQSKCTKGDAHPSGSSGSSGSSSSSSPSAGHPLEIPSNFMPIFGIIASLLFA